MHTVGNALHCQKNALRAVWSLPFIAIDVVLDTARCKTNDTLIYRHHP